MKCGAVTTAKQRMMRAILIVGRAGTRARKTTTIKATEFNETNAIW